MSDRPFVTAVLLAGGTGSRVGGETPKQFLDLAGEPVIVHSLRTLDNSHSVDAIVVVLPDEHPGFIDSAIALPKVSAVTIGGANRQASLGQGLICLPDETAVVLTHDAARPMVKESLIAKVVGELTGQVEVDGCIAAIPIEDAVKEVSLSRQVLRSRSRDQLWRAQTPQVFTRASLEDSLERADAESWVGDDCADLLIRAGYTVTVVAGDPWNIKVTRPQDLSLCERIMQRRTMESRRT